MNSISAFFSSIPEKRLDAMRASIRRMFHKQHRHPLQCPFPRVAWTGGDSAPVNLHRDSLPYRRTVSFFFREQLRECGGLDLWTSAGTSPLERARIFWNRAKGDAWATIRNLNPFKP